MANVLFGKKGDYAVKAYIVSAIKYDRKNIRSHSETNDEQFKEHTRQLMEANIIKKNSHGFEVTEKGEMFLAAVGKLTSLLDGYRKIRI